MHKSLDTNYVYKILEFVALACGWTKEDGFIFCHLHRDKCIYYVCKILPLFPSLSLPVPLFAGPVIEWWNSLLQDAELAFKNINIWGGWGGDLVV